MSCVHRILGFAALLGALGAVAPPPSRAQVPHLRPGSAPPAAQQRFVQSQLRGQQWTTQQQSQIMWRPPGRPPATKLGTDQIRHNDMGRHLS